MMRIGANRADNRAVRDRSEPIAGYRMPRLTGWGRHIKSTEEGGWAGEPAIQEWYTHTINDYHTHATPTS